MVIQFGQKYIMKKIQIKEGNQVTINQNVVHIININKVSMFTPVNRFSVFPCERRAIVLIMFGRKLHPPPLYDTLSHGSFTTTNVYQILNRFNQNFKKFMFKHLLVLSIIFLNCFPRMTYRV